MATLPSTQVAADLTGPKGETTAKITQRPIAIGFTDHKITR